MTGAELAALLGIKSKSYVSNLENSYAPIGAKLRVRFAKIFDCPPEEFEDDPPSGVDISTLQPISETVKVLGRVSAEFFAFAFDAVPEDEVPNPYPGKGIFALRISGNCMEPTLRDGDTIFLSETSPVNDGDIVLAQLDGEWTLKRYYKKIDGILLKPDNPAHREKKYPTNKLVIRAKVLPFRMSKIEGPR